MTPRLTPEQRERIQKLVDTLRTTKRRQGRGYLAKIANKRAKYCCLGIACEVARDAGMPSLERHTSPTYDDLKIYTFNGSPYTLPLSVMFWYGFNQLDPELIGEDGLRYSASELNDEKGYNFKRIADAFERTYLKTNERDNA